MKRKRVIKKTLAVALTICMLMLSCSFAANSAVTGENLSADLVNGTIENEAKFLAACETGGSYTLAADITVSHDFGMTKPLTIYGTNHGAVHNIDFDDCTVTGGSIELYYTNLVGSLRQDSTCNATSINVTGDSNYHTNCQIQNFTFSGFTGESTITINYLPMHQVNIIDCDCAEITVESCCAGGFPEWSTGKEDLIISSVNAGLPRNSYIQNCRENFCVKYTSNYPVGNEQPSLSVSGYDSSSEPVNVDFQAPYGVKCSFNRCNLKLLDGSYTIPNCNFYPCTFYNSNVEGRIILAAGAILRLDANSTINGHSCMMGDEGVEFTDSYGTWPPAKIKYDNQTIETTEHIEISGSPVIPVKWDTNAFNLTAPSILVTNGASLDIGTSSNISAPITVDSDSSCRLIGYYDESSPINIEGLVANPNSAVELSGCVNFNKPMFAKDATIKILKQSYYGGSSYKDADYNIVMSGGTMDLGMLFAPDYDVTLNRCTVMDGTDINLYGDSSITTLGIKDGNTTGLDIYVNDEDTTPIGGCYSASVNPDTLETTLGDTPMFYSVYDHHVLFSNDVQGDDTGSAGFGLGADKYKPAEILGIQAKATDNKAMEGTRSARIIAAVDKEIIDKATDYGFELIGQNGNTKADLQSSIGTLQDEKIVKMSCKGTSNKLSGDYGTPGTGKEYTYVTVAVDNVPEDATIGARFYYTNPDGSKTYYATYTSGSGATYDGCVFYCADDVTVPA